MVPESSCPYKTLEIQHLLTLGVQRRGGLVVRWPITELLSDRKLRNEIISSCCITQLFIYVNCINILQQQQHFNITFLLKYQNTNT